MAEEEVLYMKIDSNTGEIAKDIDKATKSTEKLDDATDKASGGFRGLGYAINNVGGAIKAAGLLLIAGLMAKLFDVFRSNQKVVDIFATTMTALSIAFNDLFSYIDNNFETIKSYLKGLFTDPLGEIAKLSAGIDSFLIEKFKGLILTLEGARQAIKNFANPKEFTEGIAKMSAGIVLSGREIADIYEEINKKVSEYTSNVIDQAKSITETEKAARSAAVEFSMLNAQYLKDAEVQRQIRDDETKTFEERIEANQKLSKILEEQQEAQRVELQKQVDAAFLLHDLDKTNLDNKIAYQQALVSQAELEETITGQLSEQKTNQVSLEKELLETQNELRAEGLSGIERELEELETAYKLKLDMARKSNVDITAITEQYEKQKEQIVQSGVNAQLDSYSALTGALGALAGENKELAIAQAIMDTYAAANAVLKDPTLVGPARFASAAAVIATGLANVQSIMNTQVPGGGGGGGSAPNVASAQPAPQMMSGSFELSNTAAPEPMQAYVVSDDITNNQDKLAAIRRRATI